jgi:hypothetical protein
MGTIRFETKEESNRRREEEFLKLSGEERLTIFFKMVEDYSKFPVDKDTIVKKDNFILYKNK